ncbi:hypothetical protein AAFC00_004841 [Neodothiora populina]|uniref:Uncharacterized protein n=1 Tax=Neodothiora populina TaxID=2781224 RepID=A0ABR3P3C8_9PEZI
MVHFTRHLAIAATLGATAQAFESLSVPDAITAGEEFTLTVTAGDADDAYSSYRVYLDTTPPGYKGGPSCYLGNTTSTTTLTLSDLSIPPDFGPDGSFYSLSTIEYHSNASSEDVDYNNTKTTSSDTFNLTAATGNWSAYENTLQGAPLWPADDLPCSAYSCARKCAMDSYPQDKTSGSDAQSTMKSCIMKCPGVSRPTTTSSVSSATATPTSSKGSSASSATAASSTTAGSSASGTASGSAATGTNTGAASSLDVVPVAFVAAGGLFALFV